MANPYVNKVVINGTTKIDLTADTVDASHLVSGYTAHDASGASVTGALGYGSEGTPTLETGLHLSDHYMAVRANVTNTGGVITGGTKTSTSLLIYASDLVDGTLTETANGTYDCANYESVTVAIPVYDGTVS